MVFRAYFNHLLRAVSARSTLFEKWNVFFFTKNSKNTYRLVGYSDLNALNLEKWRVNKAYSRPFFYYRIQSSALSFEKNIFIRKGQKWYLFRGCKQTKCPFFRKCALKKTQPWPQCLEQALVKFVKCALLLNFLPLFWLYRMQAPRISTGFTRYSPLKFNLQSNKRQFFLFIKSYIWP